MSSFGKGLAAVAAAAAMATTPTAVAWAGPGGASGWEPYQTPSFSLAAGVSCSFPLRGDVVYDHELTRVVERFPDGTPKVQEFQGSLGVDFTNTDTGETVRRDASGTLRATFHEAGGSDWQFEGNGIAVIRTSHPNSAEGVYLLSGSILYSVNPDGSRGFTVRHGDIENICETLA
ncbi:MAG: hypothetical protein ACRDT4_24940 [Micromonosporaceae bacterium]